MEYERPNGIFFPVDFHLPSGARQLGTYVRIVNDQEKTPPLFCWTNIAVREEKGIRLFSESDQVIDIKPESNISGGSIGQLGKPERRSEMDFTMKEKH